MQIIQATCLLTRPELIAILMDIDKEPDDVTRKRMFERYFVPDSNPPRCITTGCPYGEVGMHPAMSRDNITDAVKAVFIATRGSRETPREVRTFVNSQPCAACGQSSIKVTCAHIMIAEADAAKLGLDVDEASNFLPLCGTKGEKGTCHNAFDTASLSFYFNDEHACWMSLLNSEYKFNNPIIEKPSLSTRPHRRALHQRAFLTLELFRDTLSKGIDVERILKFIDKVTPEKTEKKGVMSKEDTTLECRMCKDPATETFEGKRYCDVHSRAMTNRKGIMEARGKT